MVTIPKRPVPVDAFKSLASQIALLALACAVLVILPYALFAGGGISSDQKDWVNFGSYVGGTLGPTFSFLALCAALLGIYLQAKALEEKEQEDLLEDEQKRNLVKQLLGDEFSKRYAQDIRPVLLGLRTSTDPQARRIGLLNLQLRDDDLIVCQTIASKFSEFYFLDDPELISQTIHAHVHWSDLRDLQSTLLPAPHDEESKKQGKVPGSESFQAQLLRITDDLDTAAAFILVRLDQPPLPTIATFQEAPLK